MLSSHVSEIIQSESNRQPSHIVSITTEHNAFAWNFPVLNVQVILDDVGVRIIRDEQCDVLTWTFLRSCKKNRPSVDVFHRLVYRDAVAIVDALFSGPKGAVTVQCPGIVCAAIWNAVLYDKGL
jgi:hypothetical protein